MKQLAKKYVEERDHLKELRDYDVKGLHYVAAALALTYGGIEELEFRGDTIDEVVDDLNKKIMNGEITYYELCDKILKTELEMD